ncbi:DUF2269 family protein [Saliterribacillus persicus]|uniref:Putative integral membrane protein DUF2269 n=1 Tax=Saliterribacillus persicus TaxID=930114 RepID=A0A368Y3R9_9BACI|nr:DUF2269 family protein [Saliterribacillus persicus]RCW74940.1 putative integral membrane protein DUF2269 [Saliterribacillus persicus]
MHSFYTTLVIIHIFSAILGMGPGFILTTVTKSAQTMDEVRHAFRLKKTLHMYVMIGGLLLLLTGLLMGFIRPYLFQQGWYQLSLLLYLLALALGPTYLKKYSTQIKALIQTNTHQTLTPNYKKLLHKLLITEYIENTLFIIIIFLMITKPF